MNSNYQLEEDQVFQTLLDEVFFDKCTEEYPRGKMEFIITPKCDYKCDYCYLAKYGDKLYPDFRNISIDTYISNIKKIFLYMKDNNYRIKTLSLFSGELFASDFGFEILNTVYEEYKKYKLSNMISIPSNFSFIHKDEYCNRILSFRDKFLAIGVILSLSCSVDGKIIDDLTRKDKLNRDRNNEYYDRLNRFCVSYKSVGFHPMISAKNVFYWKENYEWWVEFINNICSQIKPSYHGYSRIPYILEVRNDDWTDDALIAYQDFMIYSFQYSYEKIYKKNKYAMASSIFKLEESPLYTYLHVNPWKYTDCRTIDKMSCSIQTNLFVRLSDLSIVPCHRLTYEQFIYGNFKLNDEGNIIGVHANNIPMANYIYHLDPKYQMPKCRDCKLRKVCSNQCLGSNYENNNDPFVSCNSVCSLYKIKYKTMYLLYKKYRIFDAAIDTALQCYSSNDISEKIKEVREILCKAMN